MSKFYGYGIAVTKDMNPKSTAKLITLLENAPEYGRSCMSDLLQYCKDHGEEGLLVHNIPVMKALETIYNDGTGTDFETIAPVLQAVIYEAEGICTNAAKDLYTGQEYLVFEPRYPWYLQRWERDITQTSLQDIFMKYLSVFTTAAPEFKEYEWEE